MFKTGARPAVILVPWRFFSTPWTIISTTASCPTHLHLLLRSQAWMRMQAVLERLAIGVPEGAALVRGFIDAYYASIGSPPAIPTLDGYSAHCRYQWQIWDRLSTIALGARRRAEIIDGVPRLMVS